MAVMRMLRAVKLRWSLVARHPWSATFLVALMFKMSLLLIDAGPRLFLGDSASYIHTALTGWIPEDRSFLYGFAIRACTHGVHSLLPLLFFQSVAGAATAATLALTLSRHFRVNIRMAVACGLVLAIEPSQLYFERAVLAEAFGLLAFAGFFYCASEYISTRRLAFLFASSCFGIGAVAFRINFVPLAVAGLLLLPLFALLDRQRKADIDHFSLRNIAVHFSLAVLLLVLTHGGYQYAYASLSNRPMGYNSKSGLMRLCLVAPLLRAEDFRAIGLDAKTLDAVRIDMRDPSQREAQIFHSEGLAEVLIRERGGVPEADAVGKALFWQVVEHRPLQFFSLGLHTLAGYLDARVRKRAIEKDLGLRAVPPSVVSTLREHYDFDASSLHRQVSLSARAFAATSWWLLLAFALLPLVAAFVTWQERAANMRSLSCFFLAVVLIQTSVFVLFSPVHSFRYLHSWPFLFFLGGGLVAQIFVDNRQKSTNTRDQSQ